MNLFFQNQNQSVEWISQYDFFSKYIPTDFTSHKDFDIQSRYTLFYRNKMCINYTHGLARMELWHRVSTSRGVTTVTKNTFLPTSCVSHNQSLLLAYQEIKWYVLPDSGLFSGWHLLFLYLVRKLSSKNKFSSFQLEELIKNKSGALFWKEMMRNFLIFF